MNQKVIVSIGIVAILITSIGVISVLKTTLGDEVVELPGEEEAEKVLNLQESNEEGETAEEEAKEYGGG